MHATGLVVARDRAWDVLLSGRRDPQPVPLHPDPDAAYWLRLRDCLTPQGFRVTLAPSGRDLSWTGGPVTGPDGSELSSAERAQNAAVFDRCAEDVRQG